MQNFGRFLYLRPKVVPIFPKILQLLSFQWNFIHLRNRPIIRLYLALSAKKVVPKEQSSTLFFLKKIKTLYNTFRPYFLFALVPDLLLLPKNFLHSKMTQFDEFVSDFALHRRLTTESTNTFSSPETWKLSQTKVIEILLRTIKTTAKLCKSHERNLINIKLNINKYKYKATDKFPSLNKFVLIF